MITSLLGQKFLHFKPRQGPRKHGRLSLKLIKKKYFVLIYL